MPLAVKEDEPLGPLDVAVLRTARIMPDAEDQPELIKYVRQTRLRQLTDVDAGAAAVQDGVKMTNGEGA
jgi:hypothetical protein